MTELELSYLTIAEAGRRIAAGELSPLALTEAVFARIDETDGRLNSYVRLMRASATAAAREADERARLGTLRGPLDGIPIAVKDLFDTAGVVTAAGTGAYRERVPVEDATAVRLLREAGAVLLGKTNTHELALGGTTNNVHFGPSRNPWDRGRVPGGSSGGSGATLAAGQALGALGTDTAGSIRIPAAFCGITGHKPTYGLVGRGGVVPLSLTLDHAGPMARTAEDCAILLNTLAGPDGRDLDSVERPAEDYVAALNAPLGGVRLAVIPSLLEGCEPAVLANFATSLEVLRGLGLEVGECEPLAGLADDWRGLVNSLLIVEAASYVVDLLARRPQTIGEPTRGRLLAALGISGVEYAQQLQARKRIQARYAAGLGSPGGFDGYVLPTSPMVAEVIHPEPATEPATPLKFRNTGIFNQSRQPAISLPNGFDADGLPTGLQIATAHFDDALALRIAHAYQQVTDFHTQRPSL
jgi:aspartyl-tRNA(Asn)/glutamyl-tRNA(Gln) amidotransferase subunit A